MGDISAGHFESFVRALEVLSEAFRLCRQRGLGLPTIVGGAAVEHFTQGGYTTGDFDLVTPRQEDVYAVLREVGFEDEKRVGHQRIGLIHPELDFGVQVVASSLFDGRGSKLLLLPLEDDPELSFVSIEDLIADRIGQYNSAPQGVEESLEQAFLLLKLAENIDRAYLDKRIREESIDFTLAWLEERYHESQAQTDAGRPIPKA